MQPLPNVVVLNQTSNVWQIECYAFRGDYCLHISGCRKPCLILKPQPQAGFSIRLIPTITPDALPLAKLAPERNSLRLATAAARPTTAAAARPTTAAAAKPTGAVKGQKRKREDAIPATQACTGGSVDPPRLPTPQYNTGIVTDMLLEQHQQVLQSAFEAVPRLRDAAVLLKVWSVHPFCVLQLSR